MAADDVPVIITFRSAGTQPPVFLAGSFSDPAWEPHEMRYSTSEDGEHTFSEKVDAKQGSAIQYKFRVGTGNWWVIDEDAPTGI